MIIQIRGTSGSGKSTAMKKATELIQTKDKWQSVYVEGRKKPMYYETAKGGLKIYVLGHYESPCGGCDTIGSASKVFELALSLLAFRPDSVILCEGLLLSEDTKWSLQMPELRVVFLHTNIETCLERVRQRRAAVGNEKPLSEKNTRNRLAVIERARVKLVEEEVLCRRASSRQAPSLVARWVDRAVEDSIPF